MKVSVKKIHRKNIFLLNHYILVVVLTYLLYVFIDLPSNCSLKETSYSGGGNITFKGSLEEKTYFESKIFQVGFLLSELPVHFIYTVSHNFFITIAE